MGKKSLIAIASLTLSACLSAQRPAPTVAPALSGPAAEVAQYHSALQAAYNHILRRAGDRQPALVDADAAFSLTIPDHPSIGRALQYFSTELRDRIQESLDRSCQYKEMIDRILDEQDLPRGLAYLPLIESAYLPRLTSRAGAHGLWQFMPGTARSHGLAVDWWIDERAHPEKSTRAAAAYLRSLHREFGDWTLALAAYNCGPGKVWRALQQHSVKTFWDLLDRGALPRETRGYVPTFYATLLIVSDPEAHGFRLSEAVPDEPRTVELEGPVSLEFVASVTNLSPDELRWLNPELRHDILPPRRYPLRVPAAAVEKIATRAESLPREDSMVAIATFTTRKGDSIERLAQQLSIPAEDIKQMNGIRSVKAGKTILLPLRQQELSLRLQADRYHVVEAGDTLYSIARANGLSVAELRELNQLRRGHVIHPGERLRLTIRSSVLAGN